MQKSESVVAAAFLCKSTAVSCFQTPWRRVSVDMATKPQWNRYRSSL